MKMKVGKIQQKKDRKLLFVSFIKNIEGRHLP